MIYRKFNILDMHIFSQRYKMVKKSHNFHIRSEFQQILFVYGPSLVSVQLTESYIEVWRGRWQGAALT